MRWIGGIVIVAGTASALAAGPGHVDLYPVALLDVVAAVLGLAFLPASAFLRVFLVLFWSEAALFSLASVAAATGRWPVALAALTVPASLPISADVFCLLVLALARVPVIRRTTAIGDLYLASASPVRIPLPPWRPMAVAEGRLAAATIAFLVCLRQSELLVGILATFATRSFFDAMQALDGPAFWHQLLVVIPSLALARTGLGLIDLATGATLSICWRRWLTGYYVERWLGDHRHYRLALAGTGGDNPDQRIADDVHRFQAELYDLSVGLVMSLTSLVSYAILLLTLSAGVAIPGTGIVVPGLLLWCAVICAAAGSLITHLVGRPLSRLSFQSQRCEADFRFSLARLREHGEQVALAGGEAREIRDLDRGFAGIVEVFYRSLYVRMRLIFSEALIGRVSYIVPYAVMAPAFLMRRIKLGVLQQTAQAFAAVSGALGFFITRYQALADFSAVLGRLEGFAADLAGVRALPTATTDGVARDGALRLQGFGIGLPSGATLVAPCDLSLPPGPPIILTGPSGAGKSTLLRAMAGVWPYTCGDVGLPRGDRLLILTEEAYLPAGTLRDALTYGCVEGAPDAAMTAALATVGLDRLRDQLDRRSDWTRTLSHGERQRLALARAVLARPQWLLLDNATSALAADCEGHVMRMLAAHLPGTTIIAVLQTSPSWEIARHLILEPRGDRTHALRIGEDPRPSFATADGSSARRAST